jgi:hypothetical protein
MPKAGIRTGDSSSWVQAASQAISCSCKYLSTDAVISSVRLRTTLMPEETESASKEGIKVVVQKEKVKSGNFISNANPDRQAEAPPTKKNFPFHHPLAYLSHQNDIVQKRQK